MPTICSILRRFELSDLADSRRHRWHHRAGAGEKNDAADASEEAGSGFALKLGPRNEPEFHCELPRHSETPQACR
jgi:hypothetical protein